ncbi:iron ABC transporter ATP-binding protein [Insolitispirillum peregrinum]|uniref:Iron complex transport system ATP-binding protein n=1 Tax=Insolitispirillum peregrinum TaxID=80876 RepID=A0A1N7Q1U0_9PROT|nr:ABC transporter ATP-binding protein [Insolitispirillum peregrinum]SIT16567.1 iron complex transport system ATP-binding protein [Insolitispirillum peregrinum]
MIDVRTLTKTYAGKRVVDDVSFHIPPGGVVSLIGPNGAGKSTLLSMMSRLLTMDSGQVLIDGLDISRTDSPTLARRLAVLRQENHFVSRLTVRDLVSFGRYPHSRGRLGADDLAKVQEALEFLDLADLSDRFLDQLSGGQRQRAYVAMVLCQDTDYLFLDEPLNNLDMRHAVAMMRLIRRIADEFRRTVVLVIHDINFASAYSDRILAMKDGRLVHDGPPDHIMTPGVLEDIFDIPVHVEQVRGQAVGVYYR